MNSNNKKSIIVKTVLKKELGWTWLLFLFISLLSSKPLFKSTRWGKEKGAESAFIKPYALVAKLYIRLKKKFGKDKAYEIMGEIIVPVGCNQQTALLDSINISDDEPMKKLMAFNNLMEQKGATRFNDRIYSKKTDNICHFKIRRCVYKDFFDAVSTPELARFFCDVDEEFFPTAFPKFKVHRGGSWENTLAYGKEECDFIFEKQ